MKQLDLPQFCCKRPMHKHGWDYQLPKKWPFPRRRWRCPHCKRVTVEHPTKGQGKEFLNNGYPAVSLKADDPRANSGRWQYIHILKMDPNGHHVHHIDGNKKNYRTDNLRLETPRDHGKIHGPDISFQFGENLKW